MSFNFNIDIHCHPSTKAFMSGVEKKERTPFESYKHQIEDGIFRTLQKFVQRFSEVQFTTQSNFDSLYEGKFKVIVASITPMERGFLVVNRKRKSDWTDLFIYQVRPPFEDTIKPKVVNTLTGFGIKDIEFVRGSGTYTNTYKHGFEAEYKYLTATHGLKSPKHGYTVKFVKNYSEIENGIESGENALYVIVSIEGAHALASVPDNLNDIAANQNNLHRDDPPNFSRLHEFSDNIKAMKQLPFVPLFVTPLHHFWNGLGGHSRSLNKMIGELLCQEEGINIGLTALGKKVIELLLDTSNGKRVLIDIKHMSPQSRKDYYELLQSPKFKNQRIPILCSHSGIVSKVKTLDELIKQDDVKEEQNNRNYLFECSINLCKDDLVEITNSGGLVGIQLDEKRIAGKGFIEAKLQTKLPLDKLRKEYAKILLANILTAVEAVGMKEAWNIFAIGSDFDGLINHLDCCQDASRVPENIKEPVLDFLKSPEDIQDPAFDFSMSKEKIQKLMFGLSPERIVENIFSANVIHFLKKNFV